MDIRKLQRAIVDGLEDVKAINIEVFDTEHISALFERVIVASGSSNRQTRALASSVRDAIKAQGFPLPRLEGIENGEWIIVDCGAAVVHVMQPSIREYYKLEELWGDKPVVLAQARLAAAKKAAAAKPAAAKKVAAKKVTAKKITADAAVPVKKMATKKAAAAAPRPATKKVATPKIAAKKSTPSAGAITRTVGVKRSAATQAAVAIKTVTVVAKKVAAKRAPLKTVVAKKALAKPAPATKVAAKKATPKSK
jgi:ribosome-associated protein